MKVLITGGAGFIGSHLADRLLELNHEVFIIDNLWTGKLANIESIQDDDRLHFVVDTILNESVMNELVFKVDHIYHLAAAVGVKKIMDQYPEPGECFERTFSYFDNLYSSFNKDNVADNDEGFL